MMETVIDLHAHILHGVDDGPATLEQSLAMVRLAAQAGAKEIVAAVHASRARPYQPALAQRRWEELQHMARDLIRIHRACEVELTEGLVQQVLEQPQRYTIARTQYLLAEVPDDEELRRTEALLMRLAEAGLRPIVVHPELNPELARRTRLLKRWMHAGVLALVDAGSLAGAFGRRAAGASARILKRGLAHFVASGGHDLSQRPPRLDGVRLQLMGEYPAEFVFKLLAGHAQAVLEGGELERGPLREPFLRTHWFQFWR